MSRETEMGDTELLGIKTARLPTPSHLLYPLFNLASHQRSLSSYTQPNEASPPPTDPEAQQITGRCKIGLV